LTLARQSLEWAINFVDQHADGDIFPKIVELKAIKSLSDYFISQIEGKPLTLFAPKFCRRFIVPKDEISYRQATQLHPQDSILLSALIYQFGQGIEDRRLAKDRVFSYRFLPTVSEGLYNTKTSWNDFWESAFNSSKSCNTVLYCDIADFYNQIYHHTVENQLLESGLPNQAVKWIISLLESTTAGVSRGVPIGPHAAHLIAESTLIPIDNSMSSSGLNFVRFSDDIVVFCDSQKAANSALALIVSIMDKQQRIMLQRHKTRFFKPDDFQMLCRQMIEDRPINDNEDKLLGIIKKYTGGNPYMSISYNDITNDDWKAFSDKILSMIINEYLDKVPIDYIRLRWFFRRLTQVGHPGAIDVSLENLDKLAPCLANMCFYIASLQNIEPSEWEKVGSKLLTLYESEQVQNSEFFRLSILSLFSRNKHINHFSSLASKFQTSDGFARREVLLSAYQNSAFDWLREHKETFGSMDPWQKMAFLFCTSGFPADEKKFFINRWQYEGPYDSTLSKWCKST
jgi:retron-type reverse transcriptase